MNAVPKATFDLYVRNDGRAETRMGDLIIASPLDHVIMSEKV
jgi:hypothetical protein